MRAMIARLGFCAALLAVVAQGLLGGLSVPARAAAPVLGMICGDPGQDLVPAAPAHDGPCVLCPNCVAPGGVGLVPGRFCIAPPAVVVARASLADWIRGIVPSPGRSGQPRGPPFPGLISNV